MIVTKSRILIIPICFLFVMACSDDEEISILSLPVEYIIYAFSLIILAIFLLSRFKRKTNDRVSQLIRMVYVSFTSKNLSEEDLENLLTEIRGKNEKQQVTGLLLYNDRSFIQVIEGEKTTIHNLFEKIKKDPRHDTVVILLDEPIEQRSFPNWSMGYHKITDQQASGILGFSKFMESEEQRDILRKSTPEVMYLLNSFKEYS